MHLCQGSAEDDEALAVTRQGPITDPRRLPARPLQVRDAGWFFACGVPNAGLAPVELDPGMGPQLFHLFLEGIQQSANPLRRGDNIDVVEEGEKGLALLQAPLDCSKGRVLREGVKSRHQGVALLSTLALPHIVANASTTLLSDP